MSRKPKDDHADDVVATGFGRGGTCTAAEQKQHETDSQRKPPKPPTSGKTKVSASEPEDDN